MTHTLKTHPRYFRAVRELRKPFEIRRDDRPFVVGDVLILMEYDPETGTYTGEEESREVTYVVRDAPHFGLMDGFAILGMKP